MLIVTASRQAQGDPPDDTAQTLLRRVTMPWHDRVEQAFARFDLRQADGLRGFLTAQAKAVFALEAEVERCGVADLLPDWAQRRRSAALMTDLDGLGVPPPVPLTVTLPSRLHALGALYVLEGSRLGGQFLRRIVSASPDPLVSGAQRFLGHSAGARSWPMFLGALNALGTDQHALHDIRAGAEVSFALFLDAACGFSASADVRSL